MTRKRKRKLASYDPKPTKAPTPTFRCSATILLTTQSAFPIWISCLGLYSIVAASDLDPTENFFMLLS